MTTFASGTVITSTWLNTVDPIVSGTWTVAGAITITASGAFTLVSGATTTLLGAANLDLKLGRPSSATNDTVGHIYIQSVAGAPTGTPTGYTGFVPMRYDSTNDYLYFYRGGWKKSTAYT